MDLLAHVLFVGLVVMVYLSQVHKIREDCARELSERTIRHAADMARLRMGHLHDAVHIAVEYGRMMRASRAWKQAAKKWWRKADA